MIKNNFQKKSTLYQDILTPNILSDIVSQLIGIEDYDVVFDDRGYNKGRLALLFYENKVIYISFSEEKIVGRNSSFQSFSTALTLYMLEENVNKEICFYFLPNIEGNYRTDYFMFNYRLMKTANVNFLNSDSLLKAPITAFNSPEDIIIHKDQIRKKNTGNNSTYITRNEKNTLQVFGKTYGASKYETTNLCLALSVVSETKVELYEIEEGGLTKLPANAKEALESLGNVKIFTSNRNIEETQFEENNSLRSKIYIYNLFEKLGNKQCVFCQCNVPQIIQGAHIWSVADIKKEFNLTKNEKLDLALNGDNGLWLCQNHHKLFDVNLLIVLADGSISCKIDENQIGIDFIKNITLNTQLSTSILTDSFLYFLEQRNKTINTSLYAKLACS